MQRKHLEDNWFSCEWEGISQYHPCVPATTLGEQDQACLAAASSHNQGDS